MADTFYLQNQIQLELNNLERGHVYYSIDEQPEVCARLVAEGIEASESEDSLDNEPDYGSENEAKQLLRETLFGHHASVTVQSWDDVPAAIRLIRERQREFKRGMR